MGGTPEGQVAQQIAVGMKQGRRGEHLDHREGGDQEQGAKGPEAIHRQVAGAALARLEDGSTNLAACGHQQCP